MSKLRIKDAPLLQDVDGTEKIPTGGRGDYAISVDQIKDHIFQNIGKELVGLGNVDNTSDLDKPISTAQQAALNLKADKTYVDTNLDLKADKTNVYTRSETSLALSKKADLVNGVVPENQIPSSFNDVLEFTMPNLPIVGESGKIYVTTDNNKTWRWGGNKYVEISGWNPDSVSKSSTLPTYYTKEDGVKSVTGVASGAYFNVRSTEDDTALVEYQNVGGIPTPTGKSYPSAAALAAVEVEVENANISIGNLEEISNSRRFYDAELFGLSETKTANENTDILNSAIISLSVGDWLVIPALKSYKINPIRNNDTSIPLNGGIHGVRIKSGVNVLLLGELYCDNAASSNYAFFLGYDCKDTTISSMGKLGRLKGDRALRTSGGGEWGHGISLRGGINNNISNITIEDMWGDGIYLHDTIPKVEIKNTVIDNVTVKNNRRNNISIISADTVLINNVKFLRDTNVNTANPKAGIDIEPNLAGEVMKNITIQNSYVDNFSIGTGIASGMFPTENFSVINTTVINCSWGAIRIGKVTKGLIDGCRIGKVAGIADIQISDSKGIEVNKTSKIGTDQNRSFVTVSNCTDVYINDNFDLFNYALSGIHIANSQRIFCNRNILKQAGGVDGGVEYEGAITVSASTDVYLDGNNITESPKSGILVRNGSSNVHVDKNTITKSSSNGLVATNSAAVFVRGNSVASSGQTSATGFRNIYINTCTESIVEGNKVRKGSETYQPTRGIEVASSPDTLVRGNDTKDGGTSTGLNGAFINGGNINLDGSFSRFANKVESTSITYDPPSIPVGGVETTTVTMQGVVVGDNVSAAFSRYDANIRIYPVVSAANTVIVEFRNIGTAPIDLVSGTLTVKLI